MGRIGSIIGAVALFLVIAAPLQAQEKSGIWPNFSAETLKGERIILFRPSVWVGEQGTGGTSEANGDWTEATRVLLRQELQRRQTGFGHEVIEEPELTDDGAATIAAYRALFRTVAWSAMTYQFFPGNRLPTRKKGSFDWTLGQGTEKISELTGARYGLFIDIHDEYGSVGRKMFQILAAGIAGVGVTSGVHRGYAGLVDLKTGQLVWLNADGQMGGDVRDEPGMQKRVSQLLEDFPGLAQTPAQ